VIVPVRDPVIVPVREPVIIPVRAVRDPVIVPPKETVAIDKVKRVAPSDLWIFVIALLLVNKFAC
jgi:hypothetical protein